MIQLMCVKPVGLSHVYLITTLKDFQGNITKQVANEDMKYLALSKKELQI